MGKEMNKSLKNSLTKVRFKKKKKKYKSTFFEQSSMRAMRKMLPADFFLTMFFKSRC